MELSISFINTVSPLFSRVVWFSNTGIKPFVILEDNTGPLLYHCFPHHGDNEHYSRVFHLTSILGELVANRMLIPEECLKIPNFWDELFLCIYLAAGCTRRIFESFPVYLKLFCVVEFNRNSFAFTRLACTASLNSIAIIVTCGCCKRSIPVTVISFQSLSVKFKGILS